jgi:hypothetical protein
MLRVLYQDRLPLDGNTVFEIGSITKVFTFPLSLGARAASPRRVPPAVAPDHPDYPRSRLRSTGPFLGRWGQVAPWPDLAR